MLAMVIGRKARFHGPACRDGFKEDRRYGLIYPSYNVDGKFMSVEQASVECGFCAYCNEDIKEGKD